MVVPFVNYWWPSFPVNLSTEAFQTLPQPDQWTFQVAHYTPWLFYWWMTQNWFTSLSFTNAEMFPLDDVEILKSLSEAPSTGQVAYTHKHSVFDTDIYILLFANDAKCFFNLDSGENNSAR